MNDSIVIGTYTGNSEGYAGVGSGEGFSNSQVIPLGFMPKAVLIAANGYLGSTSSSYTKMRSALVIRGFSTKDIYDRYTAVARITDIGFEVCNSGTSGNGISFALNAKDIVYYYIAFK